MASPFYLLPTFLLGGLVASASAQLFEGAITLDPDDLSVNRLTIQSAPGSGSVQLAYETTGVILSGRIEFRVAADSIFTAVTSPPGWQRQTTLINENGIPIQIVTYYYTGSDAANSAEYFDFATPWQIAFQLSDPTTGPFDPVSTAVGVEVNANTIIPGLGLIPVNDSFPLAATLTSTRTQRKFGFRVEGSDPTGPTIRFNEALPGISYRIESTEDLQTWSERAVFVPEAQFMNFAFTLTGGWKPREFFRMLLIPVLHSP